MSTVAVSSLTDGPMTAEYVWNEADEGLWVLTYDRCFGGTIDRHGQHHFVMDTLGRYIGDFDTLEGAQEALIDHLRARGLRV
jgi:hypothetical protein